MILLENLELVDVKFEDKKATLTFLDADNGEIRDVNWNKKVYNDGNWVDDEEKATKVEEWCQKFFNVKFDDLALAIGDRKDVYCYDKFNSLFEVQMVSKFDDDMVGQILNVTVSEVVDDGNAIKIRFEYEGNTYESKMGYSTFLESQKQWFPNPLKKEKQYDKFKEKFHIDIEDKNELVGKPVMVEIKLAMKKYVFCDVKAFPKKKK